MSDTYDLRYSRQIGLAGFGTEGQQRLSEARVLVIGAGGLGCPALQYLTAAGVGQIGVVDHDNVALHNLHRQILYSELDIGKYKAEAAVARLRQLNSEIRIDAYPLYLDPTIAVDLMMPFDLVLDCTDDFATRYLIDDVCYLLKKPLVYGAVHRYEGQVAVFDGTGSSCFRDLFPADEDNANVRDCNSEGVIGALTGIVGTVQASEAIALLINGTSSLVNRLWTIDSRTLRTDLFEITFAGDHDRPSGMEQVSYHPYEFRPSVVPEGALLVDLREEYEYGEGDAWTAGKEVLRLPLHELLADKEQIPRNRAVAFFCATGHRSRLAANFLSQTCGFENVIAIRPPRKQGSDHQ
ncbi:MAG: molybdopterin-synthase adenylyltransferase MoeB [Bacteroidota bacterium]|jgi:adenylyltransferase/sulfurtransferase